MLREKGDLKQHFNAKACRRQLYLLNGRYKRYILIIDIL
jgi:hypothetical protein